MDHRRSTTTWWCALAAMACTVAACSGANVPPSSTVTDLLWTGLEGVIQPRSGLKADSKQVPEKRCECQSPELKSCVCCLRMSLPFLDLTTSPGCVKFKYVPDIESIAVNVTYGKGNVQNGVIKGNNPEPVCMDVLVGFGQLCARFVGNSSTPKDFDGCLKLESTLLNEVQNSIPMGCFKMDQNRLIFNSTVIDIPEEQSNNSTESGEEESEEEGEEGVDPSEEALIQAFGETAVQGVTWLVHAMGLNLNQSNNTGTITASNGVTGQQQPTPANV
ncbi:uncharacterized protein LOC132929612 [Rhopalosiphum padi]|uniref:uncharacterized protein LOC132929612 n=1 Tax=Rhopalosiphum padi TaxID=40932 RepID=UPI00298E23D4|nr:uncharacterized protein LOC132929612 [Rhopalosiphum padi]